MDANPANWYRTSRKFLSEVQVEYHKVTWPPQKEAVAGTVGVIVIVAMVTVVLGFADVFLAQLVQLVVP